MAGCADVCCLDCIIDKIRLLCIAAGLTIGFFYGRLTMVDSTEICIVVWLDVLGQFFF
jgi:hypothetical protein